MSSETNQKVSKPSVLGQKLKIFCEQRGSVKSVAAELGILPQQLQKYVRGAQKPGADILLDLKRLGCDVALLIDDEEPIGFNASIAPPQLPPLAIPAARAVLGGDLTVFAPQLDATEKEVQAWEAGVQQPSCRQLALLFNLLATASLAVVKTRTAA